MAILGRHLLTFLLLACLYEPYYLVGSHYYDIDTIAYAVSVREGSPSCGIKSQGKYKTYSSELDARLDCRDKLQRYLERMSFESTMRYWKTVPPFEPYITDIKSLLHTQAGYIN